MLKITNLIELMDIADVELQHDIPDGTVFEYKNNCYIVKRIPGDCPAICSEHCDLKEFFGDDIEKTDTHLNTCNDDCPFGYKSVAVKLSEIETLVLTGD